MEKKIGLIAVLALFLSFSGCVNKNSACWAFPFINYNGITYAMTDKKVDSNSVGKLLGEVKYYSTEETDSHSESDLFSNKFKVGTALYAIKNTDTRKAIAVKESDNSYMKLIDSGDWSPSGIASGK